MPSPLAVRRQLILGTPTFNPLTIPGLFLWLDASDLSTLFQDSALTTAAVADGDPVGGWQDKSGHGNHLTQATAGQRPLLKTARQGGRPLIGHDGVDDVIYRNAFTGGSVAQPLTFFFALAQRQATIGAMLDGSVREQMAFRKYPSAITWGLDNGGGDTRFGTTDTQFHLFMLAVAGSATVARIDGGSLISLANAGTGSLGGLTLGAAGGPTTAGGWATQTECGEVLLAAGALDTAVYPRVFAYLNAKWRVY